MMAMQIQRPCVAAVEMTDLDAWWPVASPLVDKALPGLRGRWSLEEIEADCRAGNKRLWVVLRGSELLSAVVTVIISFSTQKVCNILLCAGQDMDSWVTEVLDTIDEYAAWEGCAQVEIIGRDGWERKCPDYQKAGVWLVKELS
jgi:hypothetical protein